MITFENAAHRRANWIAVVSLFLGFISQASLWAGLVFISSVPPSDLLGSLPPVPENWKCLKSSGNCDFGFTGAPETTVTRKYEIPDKADTNAANLPTPVGILSFMVMDRTDAPTPSANSAGANKTTMIEEIELPLVKGSIYHRDKDTVAFNAYLGKRLVVQAVGHNIKSDDFKSILRKLDLSLLIALGKRLPTNPIASTAGTDYQTGKPRQYTVFRIDNSYVDELNPKASRSFAISFRVWQ